MRRRVSILFLVVLTASSVIPALSVVTAGHKPAVFPDDILEGLGNVSREQPRDEANLNTMHFSPSASNDDGIYYVARKGVDTIAYFGESEVYYVVGTALLRLEFHGSDGVIPVGEEPTGSVTNYLCGNDPSLWRTGLIDCAVLRYASIYAGIDLVYRVVNGNLKYEFIVAPHADPGAIRLSYPDADTIDVHDHHVGVSKDGFRVDDAGLWAYQNDDGAQTVECAFRRDDECAIGLYIGQYDTARELVIDPTILLVYSTFLGGSADDCGYSVALDSGCAYIAGQTGSSLFPTVNAYDSTINGAYDWFVTKLAADGQSLIYSTFIGGASSDFAQGIAVENGCAYVVGYTQSTGFPTINAYDSTHNGVQDCILAKLATDGRSLVYSTFLGGVSDDEGYGIAVESGSAYVVGWTSSSGFPTANAYDSTFNGTSDCFVTKFAANGQSLVYSSFLGGAGQEFGYGIAVESGYAYVTGYTTSSGFPTVNAYDSTYGGTADCFVTKFAANGQSLVYSTFLGTGSADVGYAIAVESGCAYVTGYTYSSSFPTVDAYDSTYNGGTCDCFVTKFAANGQSLVYSTFLGGSSIDMGYGIAVESGSAYVTGCTQSSDFVTVNAYDSTHNGGYDCFVTKFETDGRSLAYGTFLGGTGQDYGYGIAADSGCAYVTGYTASSGFPIVNAYDSTHNGNQDCFLAILASDTDYDGLLDWEELRYGTDPLCIDSDNDNFLDGYEVAYGSDPLDPMSYPAMPQAWYDAIYEDLDGNATLIQNLIAWCADNATLLETVMQQLDANATLLQQVISWLDGNHTAIVTLFSYVDGNATLLMQTVSALSGNATLIQNLIGWSDENATLLLTVMREAGGNATQLRQVVTWLDGNHTAIETLFAFLDGNATLLMQTVSEVSANSDQLTLLAALVTHNTDALSSLNATHIGDIDQIRAILDKLGVTVGDSDCDGLDDLDEIAKGTDVLCIDTDCDNLNDAFEVKLGTNPLDDDSDNDTYLDGIEALAGTNPLDALDYPGHTTPVMGVEPLLLVGTAGAAGVVVALVLFRRRMGSKVLQGAPPKEPTTDGIV